MIDIPIKSDIKPNDNDNINKNCRLKNENKDKENRESRKITNQTTNFQKELDKIIKNIENREAIPTLLLHSCCGPCSSYVLEYLSKYFSITVFYYNPNIYPSDEYWARVEEQKKIIDITESKYPINMITGAYDVDRFYKMAKGREDIPEGGERCHLCYEMRLREAAKIAKEEGFDKIATLFEEVAKIEKHHEERYMKLLGNINDDLVFKKGEETVWVCRNCGYVYVGDEAPKVYPVCAHPQSFFEKKANNY